MPELAEVFYYARQWDAGIGMPVREVLLHETKRIFRKADTAALAKGLKGAKLREVLTHGKQMLFGFSGGKWLGIHLGMTGKLMTEDDGYEPQKHDHLVLRVTGLTLVFRDPRLFGAVTYAESEGVPEAWKKLPPQPMDRGFTVEHVRKFLNRHPAVPLKTLLLDQKGFPGIGNWMADEVVWQMKVWPHLLTRDLPDGEVPELQKTIKMVCRVALKTVGRDWSDPPKDWLFAHRWGKDKACPRCGTTLKREDLRGRTVCWCPVCQAKPGGSKGTKAKKKA